MSAGTAGSSVLGTFHADSAEAVYKRAVEDLGVSKVSFTATDLIVVAGLVQPKGKKVRLRRVVQIAEVVKDGAPGKFRDLFIYDHDSNGLKPTDELASSFTLRSIAKLWGMPPMDIFSELHTRSYVLTEASNILKKDEISRPVFMAKVSEAYNEAREKAIEKERFRDQEYVLKTWRKRFKEGDR
jgi:hypothetical protein